MTSDPQERLSANGYRLFFAKIGAAMVAVLVPYLADLWGGDDVAAGYQAAMGLMAGLGTLLFLFCFATTTERLRGELVSNVSHDLRTPLASMHGYVDTLLLKNDQWLILAAVCFTGTVGYVIRNSVAAYYATYYLGAGAGMLSSFLGTGVAAAILAMVASTWITKYYCKVKLFRWTQLLVAAISIIMFLTVSPGDVLLAFVLYFMLSFVVDLHAPVFWSAIAEAVDYGQAKNGKRVSGLAFGGISFFQKAGMGVAGFVVGALLAAFGYEANVEQTPLALTGIALMLTIISGAFHLIMGLLMFKYRITDSFYNDMKERGLIADEAPEYLSESPQL